MAQQKFVVLSGVARLVRQRINGLGRDNIAWPAQSRKRKFNA